MTALDTTGRTNGAGTHFTIAGVEYVWVTNDAGKLEAQRFDRDVFREIIERAREAAGLDRSDPVAAAVFGEDA